MAGSHIQYGRILYVFGTVWYGTVWDMVRYRHNLKMRLQLVPNARIPTSAPASQFQYAGKVGGTNAAAWMDGRVPELGDPPQNVAMKFAWVGNSNNHQKPAKVVACQEGGGQVYYLYHLVSTGSCSYLYCATTKI